MNNAIRFPIIAAAGLALTACATDGYDSGSGSSGLRDASSAAEVACTSAVNANYGGNVKSISVTSSEFSQANSDGDDEGRWGAGRHIDRNLEMPRVQRWYCRGTDRRRSVDPT